MLTFLFWNVGGELPKGTEPEKRNARHTRLLDILKRLTCARSVDILILAETPLGRNETLQKINENEDSATRFHGPSPRSHCERITIYYRFPLRYVSVKKEGEKYTSIPC